MRGISGLIIAIFVVSVTLLPMTQIENTRELEDSLISNISNSPNNPENLYLDLTSWHLSAGDYIQYSNYGNDYFEMLNDSAHSPELIASNFQVNILDDKPCNFGGVDAICHVIDHAAMGNITWYEVDNHHDDHDDHEDHDGHDDHDSHGGRGENMEYTEMIYDMIEWHQTTQIYPDFSATHVNLTQKFSSWTFDLDTGDLLHESIYWENETHLSTFTGIPENITVGSQWIEEIESTISVSYQDSHDHSNSDTWQQLDNISYTVTKELEIELPPNQAANSQKNVLMNLFAIEVDDGENIVNQVTNDFFKYKYFNFELTHNQTANQQNQAGGQDGEHNDDGHEDHEHHSHVNYYSYTDLVVDSWHISAYIPDDDGDGLNNSVDQCPDGQNDWTSGPETDFDGDGCRDIDEDGDDDNDGFLDTRENECLSDPLNSTSIPLDNDGTGECDALDDDDDNDGALDVDDAFPFDSLESKDNDADGIGDNADFDDDEDSFLDSEEIQCLSDPYSALSIPNDLDQDLLCDYLDYDDDGDSYSDVLEAKCASDSKNATSVPVDTDNDGDCDLLDLDDDNDGWLDITEISCFSDQFNSQSTPLDSDEDGVCDELDTDIDEDGVNNSEDSLPLEPNKMSESVEGDMDESIEITYTVAAVTIFGLLVIIFSLRNKLSSKKYENETAQVEVEQEYDRFVDNNGTHWLRKPDGSLMWWNGSEWIDYPR